MKNLDQIKALAAAKNIKMQDVASYAGISYQQLNRIKRIGSTSLDTLEKIAEALGVPTGYFLDDEIGAFVLNGNNSPGVGKNNTINPDLSDAILRAFDEIAAQRKITEEAQRQSAELIEILKSKLLK